MLLIALLSNIMSQICNSSPQGYKSRELSMKNQILIKAKIFKINKVFSSFKFLDVAFIQLINVERPIIVGILTFMSKINFMLI